MLLPHVMKIREREKREREMSREKTYGVFSHGALISFKRAHTRDLITFPRLCFLYHQIRA